MKTSSVIDIISIYGYNLEFMDNDTLELLADINNKKI